MAEIITMENKPVSKRKAGPGRSQLYGEPTKTIGTKVPLSKIESFIEIVEVLKRQWLNEKKKTA